MCFAVEDILLKEEYVWCEPGPDEVVVVQLLHQLQTAAALTDLAAETPAQEV